MNINAFKILLPATWEQPILLGDFSKYAHLSFEDQQRIFENARFHGLDNSVYPWAVGGSDMAAIFNVSPWVTALDLYNIKNRIAVEIPVEENEEAKRIGHTAEEYCAEAFRRRNPGWLLYRNTLQVRHPKYPHCVANVDGFVIDPAEHVGVWENKTIASDNFRAIREWKAKKVPYHYLLQISFYMAVWDFDYAILHCQWGLRDSESVDIRIDRDETFCEQILLAAEDYVKDSSTGIVPKLGTSVKGALLLKSIEKTYGYANPEKPAITLPDSLAPSIRVLLKTEAAIQEVKQEEAAISKKKRELEKARTDCFAPIGEVMQTACVANYNFKGVGSVSIRYAPSGRSTVDTELLRSKFSDVYDKVTKPSRKRILSITVNQEGGGRQ